MVLLVVASLNKQEVSVIAQAVVHILILMYRKHYNPNLGTDPFHWISKGVMEDLINIGEPTVTTLVNDQVSGFSIQQIFSALHSDIFSIPQYKSRFDTAKPWQSNDCGNKCICILWL